MWFRAGSAEDPRRGEGNGWKRCRTLSSACMASGMGWVLPGSHVHGTHDWLWRILHPLVPFLKIPVRCVLLADE